MSRSHWVLSGLLILHLGAVALGAIPTPSTLRQIPPPRHPTDDLLAAYLTPSVDRGAALVYRAASTVWRAMAPLSQFARLYLRSMGLGQQWAMFWEPPKQDEYVRLRYYVGRPNETRAAWTATELVFPEGRDDELRLVRAYWTKPRDKSVFSALDLFLRQRKPTALGADTDPNDLPADLRPVCRYFGRRFQDRYLTTGERVLRTEVWFGTAPVSPRGVSEDPSILDARLDTLRRYYAGPIEDHVLDDAGSPLNAVERESDVTWVLEYYEQ